MTVTMKNTKSEELNARLVEHRRIRQETPEAEGAYLHAWRRTEQYLEYIA